MKTPASIAGHPIYPMLVPIAIGGFLISFAFDVICIASGSASPNLWNQIAYYMMLAGIVGGLAAAIPGFVDMLSLPSGSLKKTALIHMTINLTLLALYIVNAYIRQAATSNLTIPMVLSFIGLCLLAVSGWLGGKMVFEAGVGVSNPT